MSRLLVLCLAVLACAATAAAAVSRTDGSIPAAKRVTRLATDVSPATLDKVGAGHILGQQDFPITKLTGRALTRNGKPELLATIYAWCPHCAANSWALTVALERFGKLSGLREIDSGTFFPAFHHTHGLSFFRAHYSSPYLRFVPVTLQDVKGHPLESPTKTEAAALKVFDPDQEPAVDVGGRWGLVSSGYSPGVIHGKSWTQIAQALHKPGSQIAKGADGVANLFTAAICRVTAGEPRSVCTASGVVAAGARLR